MTSFTPYLDAGKRLRAERERLRLSTRDVERQSYKIAQERKSRAFYISHNSVTEIEGGKFVPRLPKLHSLSVIYHWHLSEMLALFGLGIEDPLKERKRITLPHTHLLHSPSALDLYPEQAAAENFGIDNVSERTNLFQRIGSTWGEISLSLMRRTATGPLLFGYIGTKDYTLDPLIRPGSIVQIDPRQTRIARGAWLNEHDRPIYFFELRNNQYACSWCELSGSNLLLIPTPRSRVPIRSLRYPQDADIVGRVTAVSMNIVEPKLET